jgi:ferrochelatase
MSKAVILFNLGGPDGPDAVRPFLRNLFSDPAIISLPPPLRQFLAWLISKRRTPEAQEIYAHLGGGSPLLPQTQAQAEALTKCLGKDYSVHICMRYWHPRAQDTLPEVVATDPEEIIFLPLYPQFSTTTTQSSFREARDCLKKLGYGGPVREICCFPENKGFIKAHQDLLKAELKTVTTPYRVLFSAHGIPEYLVKRGDPYQYHVEKTVKAILADPDLINTPNIITYQSRVGPLTWLQPSTDDVIRDAGEKGEAVVIVPVAFVSEHSETLVELDITYKELATHCGVPDYRRIPAVGAHPAFIQALADLAREGTRPGICPSSFRQCACLRA